MQLATLLGHILEVGIGIDFTLRCVLPSMLSAPAVDKNKVDINSLSCDVYCASRLIRGIHTFARSQEIDVQRYVSLHLKMPWELLQRRLRDATETRTQSGLFCPRGLLVFSVESADPNTRGISERGK